MNIRFYFDPACPWCWITSRWLIDVRQDRDIAIEWMPFSLALKNEEDLATDDRHVFSHKMLRAASYIKQNHPHKLEDYYSFVGAAVHINDKKAPRTTVQAALKQLSLDVELTRLIDDSAQDQKISESMQTALDVVGQDVGTPIILFESEQGWNGFFGPVLDVLPDHKAGLQLWDGLSTLAADQHFYELKRTRDSGPDTQSTILQN